jgi:branched-chain amino acid transport system permease protein
VAGLSGLLADALRRPSLRVKGLYLAIATLAAHPIRLDRGAPLSRADGQRRRLLLAAHSRPIIGIPGWERTIRSPEQQYFFAVLAIIGIIVARNIVRSRVGRALIAVRDNDIAAESSGVSLYKQADGVRGRPVLRRDRRAMLAYYFRIATVESFTIGRSVEYLAMVIIGGMGSIAGPVLGAIFIVAGPCAARAGHRARQGRRASLGEVL